MVPLAKPIASPRKLAVLVAHVPMTAHAHVMMTTLWVTLLVQTVKRASPRGMARVATCTHPPFSTCPIRVIV